MPIPPIRPRFAAVHPVLVPNETWKAKMKMARKSFECVVALAALLCAGCAFRTLPAEEMAAARTAIAAADSGASPEELRRAREKAALAQRWVDARDYGPARWLAEQAQVDAELAAARQAAEQALLALARHEQQHLAYRRISLPAR